MGVRVPPGPPFTKEYNMTDNEIRERIREMMQPVDAAIHMTDDKNDLLALACAMMTTTKNLFDQILGPDGRKEMFKELV